MDTNATVVQQQQANKTYSEACQIFEKSATMDKALNHQTI